MRLDKFEKAKETILQALKVPTETGSRSHRKITAQIAYLYADWASFHADDPDKKKVYEDSSLEWIDYCLKNGENYRYFLYNHLGNIMNDRENDEEALKAYNQAIKIDPRDFWAYRGIANINFKLQKFDESIERYN